MPPLELTAVDRRIWEEELNEFVPQRVFDVHTHIYRWAFNTDPQKETGPYWKLLGESWSNSTWDLMDQVDAQLMPGRKVQRLSFPFPFAPCDFQASNEFVSEQTTGHAGSGALMLVRPGMAPDDVEAQIEQHGFLGFKPYRFYSSTGDAVNCRITDFMPEELIEIAHRRGLLIMMHISKRDAIGDPENIRDIVRLSEQYPGCRWILAHCARSYSAWAIERAAHALRDLPNVWYDTSSVCESDAFDALYSGVGHERVMYGSDDIPVGVLRGKYIAFGFAWSYLSPSNHDMSLAHCESQMTFTRYEQLRAMRRAAKRVGMTRQQNEDLFYNTAAGLIAAVKAGSPIGRSKTRATV